MDNEFNGKKDRTERSDYASEGNRAGYTAEGRKLRPRRKVTPAPAGGEDRPRRFSRDAEPRQGGYGHRTEGGYAPRRSYGSQDRPAYGEGHRNNAYGENRRPNHGEGRPGYGENRRPSYGEGRPHYGENRRPAYGENGRPSYGENGEGRRPAYGENRPQRPQSRPPYSEGRKSGYGDKRYATTGGRPATKKKVRKEEPHFTKADEAGINQMLSRKPRLDDEFFSDNDMAPMPIKEEIRLNKFIANSGVCSRRAADTLIQAGAITVNGQVVTELGTKVNVLTDDIRMSGERLKGEKKVYAVMNKPKGFVTSASDPHAERTVMDLMKGCTARVFPVGRLDKNTTGVLMFTNDGEIAEQLTHPAYNKKKIYQVILDKPLEVADKEKILTEGLDLNDGNIKADELEFIDAQDHRRLGIEIHSGKNRIVRRIFESLGYEVKALDRVYFAGLTKKGLKKGEWRYLSEGEVNVLKMGAYV
ncbi:MAG: pseudouridine synthase [Bacteroidales bacterium]|nr:pseudouridine synthase [Bacteroidales bacterium]